MYIKSVNGFLSDVERDFQGAVLKDATSSPGRAAEQRSWEESLPALAAVLRALPAAVRAGCQIVLEARYEIEERRADAACWWVCASPAPSC